MKPLIPLAALALILSMATADDAHAARKNHRHAPADSAAARDLLASATEPAHEAASAIAPWMRATIRLEGAQHQIDFSPPHVAQAPDVDGALDDEVWSQAALLESFTHIRPVEGVRDSLGTVALVMYDDKNLYVGFHAKDDPALIQAPVVPRDQAGQGDWVGVSIDTYHDRRRSFFLCANPLGIQMDGIDQEGRDSDMAPDFQYVSKGHLTRDGYEVEMAIPFKTLRFIPGDKVTFGFNAIRDIRRNGTHMYWAPISRDVNSYHTQIGSLQNLEGVHPGRNVQINPTHTTSTMGERRTDRLEYQRPAGSFGLGAKVGLTSNLIADGVMTPDFSQVEADAGVVDINERFAIFFAEKRPFFLEGSDIFTSPINLVYTRRIVDPQYGAKLTGKLGRTSIGILNAADRAAGRGLDGLPNGVNPYVDKDAQFTIARFKQDVFKSSYVGLLMGNRELGDQYNRGLGVDGRLSWWDKYSLAFQAAQSWARDQDFHAALAALTPEQSAQAPADLANHTGQARQGNVAYAEIDRDTRKLSLGGAVTSFSPDFAADMGFVQRTDQLDFQGWVRPHLWGKQGQWFTLVNFPVYYERTYNHDGRRLTDDVLSVEQDLNFPNNQWAGMENVVRFIRFNGVAFPELKRHAVWVGTERYRPLHGGVTYVWGDQVVFAERVRGHDQRIELWSDFRFNSQFDGSTSFRASSVWRGTHDAKFADVMIPRLRLSYQFNKELSLRWITELRSRREFDVAGALVSRTKSLTPDVLVSYYVRPGTVVYAGYGSFLSAQDAADLQPERSSVFTKVSYLWQL